VIEFACCEVLNIYQTPSHKFEGGNIGNTHRADSLPVSKRRRLRTPFEFEIGSPKSHTERLEEAIKGLQSEIKDSLDTQRDILVAILEVLRAKKE